MHGRHHRRDGRQWNIIDEYGYEGSMHMGGSVFSREEIAYLYSLPAVTRVANGRISYAENFKRECVRQYKAGKSPTRIFREAGLDPELVGYKRAERCLARWKAQYDAGGGLRCGGRHQGRRRRDGTPIPPAHRRPDAAGGRHARHHRHAAAHRTTGRAGDAHGRDRRHRRRDGGRAGRRNMRGVRRATRRRRRHHTDTTVHGTIGADDGRYAGRHRGAIRRNRWNDAATHLTTAGCGRRAFV